jgi:hypothetical protein
MFWYKKSRNYILARCSWHTPVVPALRRLRQEYQEFETSLGYIARYIFFCVKKERGRRRRRRKRRRRRREREREEEMIPNILRAPFLK